jgi:hypothetical protein
MVPRASAATLAAGQKARAIVPSASVKVCLPMPMPMPIAHRGGPGTGL